MESIGQIVALPSALTIMETPRFRGARKIACVLWKKRCYKLERLCACLTFFRISRWLPLFDVQSAVRHFVLTKMCRAKLSSAQMRCADKSQFCRNHRRMIHQNLSLRCSGAPEPDIRCGSRPPLFRKSPLRRSRQQEMITIRGLTRR